MGNAATKAKAKWNAARYKQIKVSIAPEIASAFKAACETAGVSMAGELSRFMAEYCSIAKKRNTVSAGDDLATRRQRRKEVAQMALKMEQVRDAEVCSHENVPENLRGASAYEDAEDSISKMDEVIDLLGDIY
jgi:esterase/lipase